MGSTGPEDDELTVGATAELVGVSVRTLHHWDEIGLVTPSARSRAGYRLYDADDVERIHRVLVYRETGMPLAEVARVIDEPGTGAASHLARQRERLEERIAHLQRMVRAVDTMMESTMSRKQLTPAEQAEVWGTGWNAEYQDEAEQRWGGTDDWAESERRKAAMTREDIVRAKEDSRSLEESLAAALREGVEPGSERANALAEAHRADLSRWFEVTVPKQVLIARGYVADQRWTAHYDALEPGLTVWLKAVIDANAASQGVDPEAATWE
ncbi:MerR family transcriptional regulator [Actinomyces haliotis]|uniref:MerR family transcriptional regulator n=1 Tax=Actinomyces haliotis TaxID=1280843 RepID=UPI002B2681E9|nr:MerR family transcriptional regulator [Actinomyces haliotis]